MTSDEAFVPAVIVVPKRYKLRFIPGIPHTAEAIRQESATNQSEGYYLGDIEVDNNGIL
jgi:hypothetical protein